MCLRAPHYRGSEMAADSDEVSLSCESPAYSEPASSPTMPQLPHCPE